MASALLDTGPLVALFRRNDASLVVLAEIRKIYRVATIDFNDFITYRTADGKAIKNVF